VNPQESRLEHVERVHRFDNSSFENFDRIEFAMRALRLIAPKRMTVAVYPARMELRVIRGRDLAQGPGSSWALVGIPPRASRRHIAHALAELAGLDSTPFVVDLLAAGDVPRPG
jgi:hypothetical protein